MKPKDWYRSNVHSKGSVTARGVLRSQRPSATAPWGLKQKKPPPNPPLAKQQRQAGFLQFFLSSAWKETEMGGKWESEGISVLLLEVLPLSRTEIWTSPILFIYCPSCARCLPNSENFHANVNLCWSSFTCAGRIWVSLCTSGEFWAVSMSKVM